MTGRTRRVRVVRSRTMSRSVDYKGDIPSEKKVLKMSRIIREWKRGYICKVLRDEFKVVGDRIRSG